MKNIDEINKNIDDIEKCNALIEFLNEEIDTLSNNIDNKEKVDEVIESIDRLDVHFKTPKFLLNSFIYGYEASINKVKELKDKLAVDKYNALISSLSKQSFLKEINEIVSKDDKNYYNYLLKYFEKCNIKRYLVEQELLSCKEPYILYRAALVDSGNKDLFVSKLFQTRSPRYIYLYVKNNNNKCNIDIIRSNFLYIVDTEIEDSEIYLDIFLEKFAKYLYLFVIEFDRNNYEIYYDRFIKLKNDYYTHKFINEFDSFVKDYADDIDDALESDDKTHKEVVLAAENAYYLLMNYKNCNRTKCIDIIKRSRDGKYIYLTALNAGVSKKQLISLTDAMAWSKSAEYSYKYLRDIVKQSDISLASKLSPKDDATHNKKNNHLWAVNFLLRRFFNFIDKDNIVYIIDFLKEHPNYDYSAYKETIEKYEKGAEFLNAPKEEIKTLTKEPRPLIIKHFKIIKRPKFKNYSLDGKSLEEKYRFFLHIKNNRNKFASSIVKEGNPEFIFKVALSSKRTRDKVILSYKMARTKDPKYCYLYARYVAGAKLDILIDTIIECKNAEYIYLTMRDVKKTILYMNKLTNALIESKNYEYILKAILTVKDIDYKVFDKVILESNDINIIKRYLDIVKNTSNAKFDKYVLSFNNDDILSYIQHNEVDDIYVFFDKLFSDNDPKNISLTIMKITNNPGKIQIGDLIDYLLDTNYSEYLYLVTSKMPLWSLVKIFDRLKVFSKRKYNENDYIKLTKEGSSLPLITEFIDKLRSSGVPNKYIDSIISKFYLEEGQDFMKTSKVKEIDKRKRRH